MNAHTVQPDTVCGIKRNTEPSPGRESLVNKGESGNCSLMEAVKQKILLILRKRKHMGLYNKTGLLKCICQMRNLKIKGFEYSGKETSTSLLYQIHSDPGWRWRRGRPCAVCWLWWCFYRRWSQDPSPSAESSCWPSPSASLPTSCLWHMIYKLRSA